MGSDCLHGLQFEVSALQMHHRSREKMEYGYLTAAIYV